MPNFTPSDIARLVGQPEPTDQQAAVIASDYPGNALVVAGAGAGKTETMAARVVWLVANGKVSANQVRGLTFTRKAAAELRQRVRNRLRTLADTPEFREEVRDPALLAALTDAHPAVTTYDSYVGDVVREYGLLIPVEPGARILSYAEQWLILRELLESHTGPLKGDWSPGTYVGYVISLVEEMDNHLVTPAEVRAETCAALANLDGRDGKLTADVKKVEAALRRRLELLELAEHYLQDLRERQAMTFGQQMALAARLVQEHPMVGEEQRKRFPVVMLDEYQDTGHGQRIFLRGLFGEGVDERMSVMAVGDPMQSIYSFRGATSSNLARFRTDFPNAVTGEPAQRLELTTSWRNPSGVLDLANAVSRWSAGSSSPLRGEARTLDVPMLQAKPNAPEGEIKVAFFDEEAQEVEWLADELAAHWRAYHQGGSPADAGGAASAPGSAGSPVQPRKPFSAAVLVRNWSHGAPILSALKERGVPAELARRPRLLEQPEVADVWATLQVVLDPEATVPLLRLLTGPRWNIGAADIAALHRRAQQLARHSVPATPPSSATPASAAETGGADAAPVAEQGPARDQDPDVNQLREELSHLRHGSGGASSPDSSTSSDQRAWEDLVNELVDALSRRHLTGASLVDALADLGAPEDIGLSEVGAQRLREFTAELRYLRTHSRAKGLPDLVADIEQLLGVRTEVLARGYRDGDSSIGTSHLDRFAQRIRECVEQGFSDPQRLLEYFRSNEEHEKDQEFEAGETRKVENTVQILTVHGAKGLEWDIVALPRCTRSVYADAAKPGTIETWLTQGKRIPTELRGDSIAAAQREAAANPGAGIDVTVGMPVLQAVGEAESSDPTTESGGCFSKPALEAFRAAMGEYQAKESDRLFYVGITRSERVLLVSGSAYSSTTKTATDPSAVLTLLRNTLAGQAPGASLDAAAEVTCLPGAEVPAGAHPCVPHFTRMGALPSGTALAHREKAVDAGTSLREEDMLFPSAEIIEARTDYAECREAPAGDGETAQWPQPSREIPGSGFGDGAAMVRRMMAARGEELASGGAADRAQCATAGLPGDDAGAAPEDDSALPAPSPAAGVPAPGAPRRAPRTIAEAWALETALLIEEREALETQDVPVPLGVRFTATEAVALKRDAERFARTRRRPVPLKPQPFAKRGTAFHNWIERHYGASALLDEDQLPGALDAEDAGEDMAALDTLKQKFLDSPWAERRPAFIEAPYSITLGGRICEGRIDAIFHTGEDPARGWMVVDWKTGRVPTGRDREAAQLQLEIYRLAWAKVLSQNLGHPVRPEDVTAQFYYVAAGEAVQPDRLRGAEELSRWLEFEPAAGD